MPFATPIIDAEKAWVTPSVAIAVFALLFTVGSFWWIQVRRARLIVYPPSTYAAAFGGDKLVLVLPLVLYNPGPAPIVVLGLRLKIDMIENRRADKTPPAEGQPDEHVVLPTLIYWNATDSALYPMTPDGARAFASPFAVDGRKAVEKFIEFQWNPPETQLEHGPYQITVQVQTAHSHRWQKTASFLLHTQLARGDRAGFLVRPNDPGWRP